MRHDQADQYLNKIARHSARPPARQSEQQQLLLGQRTTTPSCSTSASSLFIMYLRTVAWCYIRYLCYLPGQASFKHLFLAGLCNKIRTILGYCKAAFVKRSRASPVYIDSLD